MRTKYTCKRRRNATPLGQRGGCGPKRGLVTASQTCGHDIVPDTCEESKRNATWRGGRTVLSTRGTGASSTTPWLSMPSTTLFHGVSIGDSLACCVTTDHLSLTGVTGSFDGFDVGHLVSSAALLAYKECRSTTFPTLLTRKFPSTAVSSIMVSSACSGRHVRVTLIRTRSDNRTIAALHAPTSRPWVGEFDYPFLGMASSFSSIMRELTVCAQSAARWRRWRGP